MRFLLELADPAARPRIAARLGLSSAAPADAVPGAGGAGARPGRSGAAVLTSMLGSREAAGRVLAERDTPRSLLRWLLELDDPEANYLVYQADVPDSIRRDILLGVPYGPAAADPRFRLPVSPELRPEHGLRTYHYRSFNRSAAAPYREGYDDAADVEKRGIISTLYDAGRARQFGRCRRAAEALSAREWPAVVAAEFAEPLPGYARWALCVQIGCPEELRRQLGGYHPHFAGRMRKFGFLLDGSAEYARTSRPPGRVLAVLECIARAVPERVADTAEMLRPLVETQLGENVEAWAVFAQLLPGFAGTLPELIVTSGAIAAS